ncbi:MAG: ester cyclase [Halomonas meridiana]|uniref:ester cyclase n=1 Tax=Halomonadaceae TaxID=28256 RepID=UPI00002DD3A5|nr:MULTISPECIES: ester cyclase [Halomonas]MCC4290925.1 ester cyclase [Halomonas axialensis]MCD2088978.1 ester cyclase [Halomonas meridiana]MDK2750909.1 ester cyclase [Halomonas meridiana]MDP4556645.1 ester cyclase [Halomonas meridiana]
MANARTPTSLGLEGYRAMLEANYEQIPDLHFNIELLAIDSPHVACRLRLRLSSVKRCGYPR